MRKYCFDSDKNPTQSSSAGQIVNRKERPAEEVMTGRSRKNNGREEMLEPPEELQKTYPPTANAVSEWRKDGFWLGQVTGNQ